MKPLEGVLVLELGQVVAAPYAGLLLADLGAEVIKIERPPFGDSARDPQVTGMRGQSATFLTFNRNKKSIALDLSDDGDYATFLELVVRADVVVSNLLPLAARKLKVDSASLRRQNERLITCTISSFGSEATESEKPSYDLVHQALTGFMMLNGQKSDPPTRMGIPIADLASGLFAAYGILAALQGRHLTGQGEEIDISMYECMLSLLTYQATMYLTAGVEPQRMGSAHEHVVPWQAFRTVDGWIVVAIRANHFWVALCQAMRMEHLIDDLRFHENKSRLENRIELESILAAKFLTDHTDGWLKRLSDSGVPAAKVRTVPEALDAEILRPDGIVRSTPHPDLGEIKTVANPVRFSEMELAEHDLAPELDQHRESLIGPVPKNRKVSSNG